MNRWLHILLTAVALATAGGQVWAQATGGAFIDNVASAQFVDSISGATMDVQSNRARIQVAEIRSFTLESGQLLVADAGTDVLLPHVLTLAGNVPVLFTLATSNVSGDAYDLGNLHVVVDSNANGQVDAGEATVSQLNLQPGDAVALIVVGSVPAGLADGALASLTISATPDGDAAALQSNTDRVVVGHGAVLDLAKSSVPACNVQIDPGSEIRYDLRLVNSGITAPRIRNFTVDGNLVAGVLLEDIIPANTHLRTLDPILSATGGRVVVKRFPSGPAEWISFTNWRSIRQDLNTPLISHIGIIVPASALEPGKAVDFSFFTRVNDTITPGTVVRNRATIDLDGDGQAEVISPEACNTLRPAGPNGGGSASLRFLQASNDVLTQGRDPAFESALDTDLVDTGFYKIDRGGSNYDVSRDGIYLEVFSTSLNASGFGSEVLRADDGSRLITVTLRSLLTGDQIQVVMKEVEPNSGLFRALTPVRLVDMNVGAIDRQCPANLNPTDPLQAFTPDYSNRGADNNCSLHSRADDTLIAELLDADGNLTRLEDEAVVDPAGFLYDSQTGQPVDGGTVRVIDLRTGEQARFPDPLTGSFIGEQVTGAGLDGVPLLAGFYQYAVMAPGCYFLEVIPPAGYTFPSVVQPPATIAAQSGFGDTSNLSYGENGPTTADPVTPAACSNPAFVNSALYPSIPAGAFQVDLNQIFVAIDLPVDPSALSGGTGGVGLEKVALLDRVSPGDFVPYRITLSNQGNAPLDAPKLVDQLPFGLRYVPGSARLDGQTIADPLGTPGPQLDFDLGNQGISSLAPGDTHQLEYVLLVSAGASHGSGINRAQLSGSQAGQDIAVQSSARVRIVPDPLFSERGYVFGKVFLDADCDSVQTRQEWPVGGVRLYFEDGTYVITDENGQYSLYGIKPGNHVVKVDTTTLPAGVRTKPLDNRNAADGDSRFVDLTPGELHRADFAIMCPCANRKTVIEEIKARNADINGDWSLRQAEQFTELSTQSGIDRDRNRRTANDGSLASGQLDGPEADAAQGLYPAGRAHSSVTIPAAVPTELPPEENAGDEIPDPELVASSLTREMGRRGHWLWPMADSTVADGRFMVVVPAGVEPELWINNERVADTQLGARIENRSEQAQVLAWYGVPLEIGSNAVQIRTTDMFGNRRILAERVAIKASAPARLRLVPRSPYMDADGGRSFLGLDVSVEDAQGNTVAGSYFLTIEASDGQWIGEDLQSDTPGHQVRIQDGRGVVFLKSSLQRGQVTVRVSVAGQERLRAESQLQFIEPMRPLIAVGLLELGVGSSNLDGEDILPAGAGEFDRALDVDGRAAMFLKGKIRGDVLLTMSYDSDKDGDVPLFRDIDPGSYYPVYGDASIRGYEAQSRDRLFVRLERGTNSVQWGDFLTDNNQAPGLFNTRHALTGANLHLEGPLGQLQVFGAGVSDARQVEEFRGNGTATDYRLGRRPIIPNSEIVERIERSLENPGLVVSVERLDRFGDYSLDPVEGFLSFARAIPSENPFNGNPISIRVTYDTEGNGDEHLVTGVRGSINLSEELKLSAGYTRDENPDTGSEIAGVRADYALSGRHQLSAEVAQMRQPSGEQGMATRLAVESSWSDRLRTLLRFGRAESGFSNRDGVVSGGRQEAQLEATGKLTQTTELRLNALHSSSLQGPERRESVELGLAQQLSKWTLESGLRHTRQQAAGDGEQFQSARLRLERGFSLAERQGRAHVELEQDLSTSARRSVQFGTDVQVQEKTRLYARHQVINSLSGFTSLSATDERSTTVIGLESDWLPSTQAYTELRQRGGIDGRDMATATGVRTRLQLREGEEIDPSVEYIRTHSGPDTGDHLSISVGYSNTRNPNARTALRLETRLGDRSKYYGGRGSVVARISQAWTALVRAELGYELPQAESSRVRLRLATGIARRPRERNGLNLIGMAHFRTERGGSAGDTETIILSGHANHQIGGNLRIAGHLAGKWQEQTITGRQYDSTAQLVGGRVIWDLNRRWDVDVHAAVLGVNEFESRSSSFGTGVHFLPRKNLRVGLRYNFLGFSDRDLDEDNFYADGLQFGIQFKFDESAFDWLQ